MKNEIYKNALRLVALLMLITGAAFVNAALAQTNYLTQRQQQQQHAKATPQQLSPEHAASLQKWLETKPGLRLATLADCQNKEGLQSMRQSFGKGFHPYYLVKDFNGDAVKDFAVALVASNAQADSQFTLVIFHGARNSASTAHDAGDGGGAFKAVFTQEGLDLRQGGLWPGELIARRTPLYVGVFETDDCSYLKWNGRRYVIQPCEGN